ncbi:interferon-inducible GTPase [Pimephales promelas]|nr:interferon-inducible GTPase [Pimephales promelas]
MASFLTAENSHLRHLEDIKESIDTQDLPSAINTIKNYLDMQDLEELNIGITGESGSGKSSFVNAFRGLGDEDEGSAETGVVETTMEPKVYLHPQHNNVKVWDLPGIGSPNFKTNEYLKLVNIERYDVFIVIAADRFKECHELLAKEITGMGKKFYFVRSKIDSNIAAEKRKKKANFDEKNTLRSIREYCENGLREIDVKDPVVFLISSHESGNYDFDLLEKKIEADLPEHKRDVLLLALPNITLEINEKKKKAQEKRISRVAFLSALGAAVPVPGLSIVVDSAIITKEIERYFKVFGLDDESLQKLCENSQKSIEHYKSLMKSSLRGGINPTLVFTLLSAASLAVAGDAVEYAMSLIPIIGTVIAGGMSFCTVSAMLHKALNEIAEDARNVLLDSVQTEV